MSASVHPTRISLLNSAPFRENGRYILYWMQQSQRAEDNDALEYAIEAANLAALPLLVCFGLTDGYPEANARHYTFMLEGLRETAASLRQQGIGFAIEHGEPTEVAIRWGKHAALLVCDRGYLRHQVEWRTEVAAEAGCRTVQVEADVVVPVEVASSKCEIGARTLRPRIWRNAEPFLMALRCTTPQHPWNGPLPKNLNLDDPAALCAELNIDHSIIPVSSQFKGGTSEAKRIFRRFVAGPLQHSYAENRSHPETGDVSHMSKYLHFGQISPVWLALKCQKVTSAQNRNAASFLEELIVRRELAINFVHYNDAYDCYDVAPAWARATLETHRQDHREHLYTRSELENARTHDPYWNAAMLEMRTTGGMHNHMRMYWGKKILTWTESPAEAHATILHLNNRYFVDGRDPSSYANVAWLFGSHDRPWPEREIYGKVRSMVASGLERKCDIRKYCRQIDALVHKYPF